MHRYTRLVVILVFGILNTAATAANINEAAAKMVREITTDVQRTRDDLGQSRLAERVLEAMSQVPRHEFVPEPLRGRAYDNRPLPIGHGQTISQPYIVAIMTDLLRLQADDVVFELGTGSGYQAAVLADLVKHVYSVEIIADLGQRAEQTLSRLGYSNVSTRVGDGYHGWAEHAPFDAIIVTAAGDHIPPPLVQQLKPGGRMIMPVGSPFLTQQLVLIEKQPNGTIHTRALLPVRFVPLTGSH